MPIAKTVNFTLTVTEAPATPDFFPSVDPADLSVVQGTVAQYLVHITPVAGFYGLVQFAVTGLPAGAVAFFDTNPALPTDLVTLTIGTANLDVGTYQLALEATELE